MAGNKIFRGPVERQARTVTRNVAGAYLPGTLVEDDGTELTELTTALSKRPLVLNASDFAGQALSDAYVSGATAVAYEPQANDVFQCRMAAATYSVNDPLTIGASGQLEAAAAGGVVVAFFSDTAGAVAAGELMDVIWASAQTVPA